MKIKMKVVEAKCAWCARTQRIAIPSKAELDSCALCPDCNDSAEARRARAKGLCPVCGDEPIGALG